ncbi:MAG: hypothetical protein LUD84_01770, partial [Clostridiales bacterium]|nr:hypothetical protein [Clostridiales bacterium]
EFEGVALRIVTYPPPLSGQGAQRKCRLTAEARGVAGFSRMFSLGNSCFDEESVFYSSRNIPLAANHQKTEGEKQ